MDSDHDRVSPISSVDDGDDDDFKVLLSLSQIIRKNYPFFLSKMSLLSKKNSPFSPTKLENVSSF